MARVLCVDYGERRMGIALSDPTGTIAAPLRTLERKKGKRPPWREILTIVETEDVETIVVGLPLDTEGGESEWTREVRTFGNKLGELAGLPVVFVDERMSSGAAERIIRTSDLRKSRREEKGRIDAAAASIILQTYLARRTE